MGNRAKDVISKIYDGENVRTAISEAIGFVLNKDVETLLGNSVISALAKEGDEKGLILYISNNIDSLNLSRRLTQKQLRRIARELVARSLPKVGDI